MLVEDLLPELTPEEHNHLRIKAQIEVAVYEEDNQRVSSILFTMSLCTVSTRRHVANFPSSF